MRSASARSIQEVDGAGHSEGSFCIEVHRLGPEMWPIYGVYRGVDRGFVSTVLYGDAFRTKVIVSGRYREGGRLSGVAVKRGSLTFSTKALYGAHTLCAALQLHTARVDSIARVFTLHGA